MLIRRFNVPSVLLVLIPLLLFWVVLNMAIPSSLSKNLTHYSAVLFLVVTTGYYGCFRLRGNRAVAAGLAITMLLFALSISYKWSSAYSDTGMIGGLLPYKDAKDYFYGANRMLDGLALEHGVHSMRRPLFPGLLASLLLLTRENLKVTLALLAQLSGIAFFLSARQIHKAFGEWAAALYSSLMFFYIQPMLGYATSESAGFMLGCWAFAILWPSAAGRKIPGLIWGSVVLMAAVAARAGAFLIFPMLIVWAGYVFRAAERFSWRAAAIAAGISAASYWLMSITLPDLLGVPPGSGLGSFAYALYGQVHGGTGWHSAIDDLNTTQVNVILSATLRFFLAHPLSFVIAAAKSYRDLFLPGPQSIFVFGSNLEQTWLTYALWLGTFGLIIVGIVRSVRNHRFELPALVLAGFVGIVLSVPFLPPIDGGGRFYASTMPFLYVLPAIALGGLRKWPQEETGSRGASRSELVLAAAGAVVPFALTTVVPVLIYLLTTRSSIRVPVCPVDQRPFAFKVAPDSYLDIVPDTPGACGVVPVVCLSDFEKNGTEKSIDDFFQELLWRTSSSSTGIRITPAIDMVESRFHYFLDPSGHSPATSTHQIISGCAIEVNTRNQSIYQIMSYDSDSAK